MEEKIILFSNHLKKNIVNEMISCFSTRKSLNPAVVKKCTGQLVYHQRTMVDVFLDFKRKYNVVVKKYRQWKPDYYIPKLEMEWGVWKQKCARLDSNCTKLKISEVFPYMAVCYLFGIASTFDFIRELTGYSYKSELLKLFPEGVGEDIQHVGGHFAFRHNTVAANYFFTHPEITPYSCLMELVSHKYMDENTALIFEQVVFLYPLCHCQKKPWIVFIKKLFWVFQKNKFYAKIMKKYNLTISQTRFRAVFDRKVDCFKKLEQGFEFTFEDCAYELPTLPMLPIDENLYFDS